MTTFLLSLSSFAGRFGAVGGYGSPASYRATTHEGSHACLDGGL